MANKNPSEATRFSSTNQPKKNGRKPSKLKKFLKDYDLSSLDLQSLITNLIFDKTQEELTTMVNDKSLPMIIRIFIKAIKSDYDKSSIHSLERLLDRAGFKPSEKLEISGQIKNTHILIIPNNDRSKE